jgi:glucose-1-phosphate thymidylyltransferase
MNVELSKTLCLERDAHRCRHCGTTDNIVVVQLYEKKDCWLLSNLITLCESCKAAKEKCESNSNDLVGVILAGGKGTRVYPLTKYQNKHTLSVGLTPMLFYPLKTLRSLGVKKCIVVIDRENTGSIISMLGGGKEFGMDISYKVQEGAGGISDALYLTKDLIKPNQKIVCVLGDNIFDNEQLDRNNLESPCVYIKRVTNPQDYGVAEIEDGCIKRIVEKPKQYLSDLAVVGLYVYDYDVFSVIENVEPSARGELEISSVNDHYASLGVLKYKMVNGFWGDAGSSIQKYAECSMYGAKESKVSMEEIENFKNLIFDVK